MRRLLSYLLALALLASCVETIVMDPLEEMPPVVCCVLTRDGKFADYGDAPVQSLKLYYARRASETGYVSIPDASVSITADRQTYPFTWDGEKYTCAFWPHFRAEYKLKITLANGKLITASTRYPNHCEIVDNHPVYSGRTSLSAAGYCWVYWEKPNPEQPYPENEIYLWITPSKEGISNFVTNHPGADGFNIVAEGLSQNLPVWPTMKEDYKELLKNSLEECKPEYWDKFEKLFVGLPIHKGFLRIVHPLDFDNGIDDILTHSVPYNYSGAEDDMPGSEYKYNTRQCFILETDALEKNDAQPGWVGSKTFYTLPIQTHVVSKEYDHYLRAAVNRSLHADELTSLYDYDLDADYSNIEGGIGIFGGIF